MLASSGPPKEQPVTAPLGMTEASRLPPSSVSAFVELIFKSFEGEIFKWNGLTSSIPLWSMNMLDVSVKQSSSAAALLSNKGIEVDQGDQ